MLTITVPGCEWLDETQGRFMKTADTVLTLEHSLVSVHKWEQRHCKPFLSSEHKTDAECMDYVRCMTLTQNVNPLVYSALTPELLKNIDKYIEAPMTATWFSEEKTTGPIDRKTVTAEVIYYWMITLGIPWECRKWHLNTLMTLIRVCNAKNAPKRQRSQREMIAERRMLNKMRREQTGSRG